MMRTDIQEIYATAIRPLPDEEKLQIATLILEDVTKKNVSGGEPKKRKRKDGDITKFFGAVSLGHATGSDNESIDADLARSYADNHENED